MRQRIAYLHVPKTAGNSVGGSMRDAAGPEVRWCPFVHDPVLFGGFDRFDDLPDENRERVYRGRPDELAAWDVVTGHFALPTLLGGFAPGDVMTLMREPRSRILSHYTFWRGWTEDRHAAWGVYDRSRTAAERDWEGFLTEPLLASQVDNLVLRLVLGRRARIPADGFIDPADLPGLVADAVAAVDTVGFADVIERGADCWRALGEWLGVRLDVGRRNESSPADDTDWSTAFTPGAAAALAARSAGDRALWAHVAGRAGVADPDALAESTWQRHLVRLSAGQVAVLRAEVERGRDEVQRWERSTTARVTRPIRAGRARLAARLRSRR